MSSITLFESDLRSLELIQRGKVRDLYAVDDAHLLMVATDRLSAFDVVLPDPIPGKGHVLTAMSCFWFGETMNIVDNHLATLRMEDVITRADDRAQLAGRSLVVRRLRALPIECVVRGYLTGSGWAAYRRSGQLCGIRLPAGLAPGQRLPEPLFTPASKAAVGEHDENIDYAEVVERVGAALAAQLRTTAIALYTHAAAYARARGLIIADTKFEFGLDDQGRLVLIDEVLTPDSSRFWSADHWSADHGRAGQRPVSFDKQFVRDYLETLNWDKTAPGPRLPEAIIARTAANYREVRARLLPGDE